MNTTEELKLDETEELNNSSFNCSKMSIINGTIIVDDKPIGDLKVTELRRQLEIRNLSKSGVKKELYERLKNYILNEENVQNTNNSLISEAISYNAPAEYRSLCEVRSVAQDTIEENQILEIDSENVLQNVESESLNENVCNINIKPVETEENIYQTENSPKLKNDEKNKSDYSLIKDSPSNNNEKIDKTCLQIEESEKSDTLNNKTIETDDLNRKINIKQSDTVTEIYFDSVDNNEVEEINKKVEDEIITNENLNVYEINQIELDKNENKIEENLKQTCNNEQIVFDKLERRPDDELDYEEEDDQKSKEKFESEPSTSPTSELATITDIAVLSKKKNVINENKNETKQNLTAQGLVRLREVSPARNKISQLLHIRNLKRPFTIKALKELLSNFGKLIEDDFWIDGIKTNCIVKFENEEQSQLAREQLHNVIWPSSSDTSLIVEYSTDEKLARRRGDDANLSTGSIGITVTVDNKSDVSIKRNNLKESSKKTNNLPKKQLEDLFKKTNTKPSVYYLPLNDSEAEKRWAKKKRFSESNTTKCGSLSDRRRHSSLTKRGYSPDHKRDRRDSVVFRRH